MEGGLPAVRKTLQCISSGISEDSGSVKRRKKKNSDGFEKVKLYASELFDPRPPLEATSAPNHLVGDENFTLKQEEEAKNSACARQVKL